MLFARDLIKTFTDKGHLFPMPNKLGIRTRMLIALLFVTTSLPAADWLTFGHDPQRSGWANEETKLAAGNVAGLELKWKTQVKNEPRSLTALTAPLVATDVSTAQGRKTLVYVAGSSNNISALDAASGSIVWTRAFESSVLPKHEGMWLCPNGLNATPTIDKSNGTIYVIAYDGKIYGLDLGTGNTKFGPVQFVPAFSKNWSLNLADGVIYTSISQGCGGAQSGFYSIDVRDPLRPVIRNLFISRDGGAGIWGRGGPVIGKNGRIYGLAGDGPNNPSGGEFGSAVIAASMPNLEMLDYFRPSNWDEINKYDLDMGAGSPVWFVDKNHNLLAAGGKEGVLYLMDADSLGGNEHQSPIFITSRLANDGRNFQGEGLWGAPSAWRDEHGDAWIYVPIWGALSKEAPNFGQTNGPTPHGSVVAFKVSFDSVSKKPLLQPAWVSGDFNLPEPVVIAGGVVFGLSTGENARQTQESGVIHSGLTLLTDADRRQNTTNAALYALDAKTGKTLWESGNAMPSWVHFSGLAVADGNVYAVDHDSRVYCFGLKTK
jgi:outer membrane protein assembly factor BamB